MTNSALHTLLDILLDKAGSPYFNTGEKDEYLTLAQNEIVKTRFKEFELNENTRSDLRTLVKEYTTTTNTVSLTSVTEYMYTVGLRGSFDIVKYSGTVSEEKIIRPIQLDDYQKIVDDPFNKPTNSDPVYIEIDNELQVKSDISPSSVTLTYVKIPDAIDATSNPTTEPELPEHMHEEIAEIAFRKMTITIEDYNKYQAQAREIIEKQQ